MQTLIAENIIIQPITHADLNEVLDIEKVSFKDPWSKGMFVREIGGNNFFVLHDKNTDQILGYFGYWQILDEFHIVNLAVRPEYRQRGIGSEVLQHLLSEAKKRKCSKVMLEVRLTNLIAQKLYFKFGFEVVGRRKGYYSDSEDALLLEKRI